MTWASGLCPLCSPTCISLLCLGSAVSAAQPCLPSASALHPGSRSGLFPSLGRWERCLSSENLRDSDFPRKIEVGTPALGSNHSP